jgi:hypothetical protein
VTLPKEQQVANAVVTYESDLFGALKAPGAITPQGAPARSGARRPVTGEADHPINPKIIGTAQDAQLTAALDLLGGRAAAR